MRPSDSPRCANQLEVPAIEPMAMLWSPPSTSGMRPSSSTCPTRFIRSRLASRMGFLYRSLSLPTFWVSAIITSRSP